jgi:hypothetical protein
MQIIFLLSLALELASDATAIQKLNSIRNDKFGPEIDKQMKLIIESQKTANNGMQNAEIEAATKMIKLIVHNRNEWFPWLEREGAAKKGDVGKFAPGTACDIFKIVDDWNVIVDAGKYGYYWIDGLPTSKMNARDAINIDKKLLVCDGFRKYGPTDIKWFRVVKSFNNGAATIPLPKIPSKHDKT